jgi:hypothetical protein
MSTRNFVCPLTEEPCVRDECTINVCVTRQLEEANFNKGQSRAKERSLRAKVNPTTGKLELPGKLEDYGL